jgi:hypothetical protein
MAVINSQLEFSISYPSDGVINSYIERPSRLGIVSQVDTYSFGFREVAISYFNYCVIGLTSLLTFTKGIGCQDYLSSHARFFGNHFKQDANNIYITKSDLPSLTPEFNNTAESLFIALLLRTLIYESNDFISLIKISHWGTSFVIINQIPFRLTVLVIEINVPAKYKYVKTEIINANDALNPKDL